MMKITKYLLVTIGVLGILASLYMGFVHREVMPNLSSFIASLSLVYLELYKVVDLKPNQCRTKIEKAKDSF